MKRTLFSICALVLSLTASAQIIKDTPKGKLIETCIAQVSLGLRRVGLVHKQVDMKA